MLQKLSVRFFLFFFLTLSPFTLLVPKIHAQSVGSPVAIPTFHSMGIEWSPSEGASNKVASVRFRQAGTVNWIEGFPLWYSSFDKQYRGSLVHLQPGTSYEISLTLAGSNQTATLSSTTWSENFPIAKTVTLSEQSSSVLNMNQSGTANGYVLYAAPAGKTATIDVGTNGLAAVEVNASYVILRGVTIKGGDKYGIKIGNGSHDVVIEKSDISGWGRYGASNFGRTDGAIGSNNDPSIKKIVIQRNKIHDPRYDTNSWMEERSDGELKEYGTHPDGPQSTVMNNPGGQIVFRYNSVFSNNGNWFNDCVGGGDNFSSEGFPNRDSDIYGNYFEKCWDNAIEAEGGNRNVRVWGNYINETYKPIATRETRVGPLYIWRNVSNIGIKGPKDKVTWSNDPGGSFHKGGVDSSTYDRGVFEFHNTVLQPTIAGANRPVGASEGPEGQMYNTTTRNNIFQTFCPTSCYSILDQNQSSLSSFDYDLYNGKLKVASGNESHGIFGTPVYQAVTFDAGSKKGNFSLASSSPGFDAALVLPNFNAHLIRGAGPDIGAHEAGMPNMEFGEQAYINGEPYTVSVSGSVPTPNVTPVPTSTTTPGPTATVTSDSCPEDINQDHVVNLLDYSILVADFFKSVLSNSRSDIDGDGSVNLFDYSRLVGRFFDVC